MGLIQTPHLDFLDVEPVVFPNHSFSHPLSSTNSLVLTLVRRLCFCCSLLNYPKWSQMPHCAMKSPTSLQGLWTLTFLLLTAFSIWDNWHISALSQMANCINFFRAQNESFYSTDSRSFTIFGEMDVLCLPTLRVETRLSNVRTIFAIFLPDEAMARSLLSVECKDNSQQEFDAGYWRGGSALRACVTSAEERSPAPNIQHPHTTHNTL